MQVCVTSIAFVDRSKYLFGATNAGEILVWELTKFWSASYWSSSESSEDLRRPLCRVKVCDNEIYRIVVVNDGADIAVCGRDGVAIVPTRSLLSSRLLDIRRLPVSFSQRCFNAMSVHSSLNHVVLGCEDGTIVHTDISLSHVPSLAYECGCEGGGVSVLDLSFVAPHQNTLLAACSSGHIWAFHWPLVSPIYRISLHSGSSDIGPSLPDFTPTLLRCSVVRSDPSGRWILVGCSGGSRGASSFFSLWHADTRECVAVMPSRGAPSGACWTRGSAVCVAAEEWVRQFSHDGTQEAQMRLDTLHDCWDVQTWNAEDDVVGSVIAIAGNGPVAICTAVGRQPFYLARD